MTSKEIILKCETLKNIIKEYLIHILKKYSLIVWLEIGKVLNFFSHVCCKYAKFIEMFPNIYTKKPITNQHVIACRTPQDVEPIKLCH